MKRVQGGQREYALVGQEAVSRRQVGDATVKTRRAAKGGATRAGRAARCAGAQGVNKPPLLLKLTNPEAFRSASARYRQQRIVKHRDRMLDELAQPTPDAAVVKGCIKKLSSISGGRMRFIGAVPGDAAGRAAMRQQWGAVKAGAAHVQSQLNRQGDTRFDAVLQGMGPISDRAQARVDQVEAFEKQQAAFAKTTLDVPADVTGRWQFSGDGGTGAILERDGAGQVVAAIKAEDAASTAKTIAIAKAIDQVHAGASNPLPFDFPQHKLVQVQAQSPLAAQMADAAVKLASPWDAKAKGAEAKAAPLEAMAKQLKADWEKLEAQVRDPALSLAAKQASDAYDEALTNTTDAGELGKLRSAKEDAAAKAAKSADPAKAAAAKQAKAAYEAAQDLAAQARQEVRVAEARAEKAGKFGKGFDKDVQVVVQSGVPGALASRADAQLKHDALRNREFGQDLGASVVLQPLLGLGDHLAPDRAGEVNFSNLMIHKEAAAQGASPRFRLGVIDFSPPANRPDPKAFQQLAKDLATLAGKDGDGVLAALGKTGSLPSIEGLYLALCKDTSGGGNLMDKDLAGKVTDADRKKLMGNVLAGIVRGIEYFENNREVFAAAHEAAGTPIDKAWLSQVADAFAALPPKAREALKAMASA